MIEVPVKTAYSLPEPSYRTKLTDVRKGTPTGEYLRRYWHPVALAEEATDLPRKVRVLGEDLILFRDKSGRPGLMHPRCCHRGSSLFYGAVEEDGIRCCYHGWKFAVDGRCIDRPLEKDGGGAAKNAVRQPWYPVKELYGLVFAYMGPPEKIPVLPRYDVFEDLDRGHPLQVDGNSFGSMISSTAVPFNWFQHYENIHDMGHAFWLHHFHSGPQFGNAFDGMPREALPFISQAVNYERNDRGVRSTTVIPHPDGRIETKVIETILPTLRAVPAHPAGKLDHLSWVLPIDETQYRIFTVCANPDIFAFNDALIAARAAFSPERVQREPGDFEAQGSQGAITLHSEEHLVTSDKGVVMLRRVFEEQVDLVASGGDPINVTFDPAKQVMQTEAGNWFPEPAKADLLQAAPDRPFPDAAASADQSANIAGHWAGHWILVMKTPMGEQTVDLVLTCSAGELGGTMSNPQGEPTTVFDGRFTGDRAVWKTKLTKPMAMTVSFDVTLKDGALSGTFKAGLFPAGPVTARRG